MAERKHKFAYNWRLLDGYPAPGVKDHRSTVFGTFVCGGGSTMGYKLAGYRHLGGVEIDPKIAAVYRYNNDPELMYVEDLRKFNGRGDLPDALYDLDVLDGSPPCTSFSMTGLREKGWGKRKPCDVGFNTVLMRTEKRDARFNWKLVRRDRVCPTLCADDLNFTYDYPRRLNGTELSLVSSFPLDFQCTRKELTFVTGMCVPPVMMAHIADAIYNQWLRPIKEG